MAKNAQSSNSSDGHFGGQVGYANPPRPSQFEKGQSGNPKGRPKGTKNIRSLVQDELKSISSVLENGQKVSKQSFEIVLIQLRQKAMKGDERSMKLYFDIMAKHGDFEENDGDVVALTSEEEKILQNILTRKVNEHGGTKNEK